jgi:hypothetical protein
MGAVEAADGLEEVERERFSFELFEERHRM